MKFITAEEASQLPALGKGRSTLVRKGLALLQVGQAMIIEKDKDWISKKAPYGVVNYFSKQTGRTFLKKALADGTGWVIERIS